MSKPVKPLNGGAYTALFGGLGAVCAAISAISDAPVRFILLGVAFVLLILAGVYLSTVLSSDRGPDDRR